MKVKIIYILLILAILTSCAILLISSFSDIVTQTSFDSISQTQPTVIIDAGHGGEDGGAQVDGVLEKDINLQIADKLADMLRLCGYRVVEIRNEDISVYEDGAETLREKKVSDLKRRVAIANESERNILVSIHQNKFDNSAYSGTQVFYSENDPDSIVLAQNVRRSVTSLLQKDNKRELKPGGSDIYLLKNATVPAIIVECGFLSNSEERAKLTNSEYQSKMAYSVAMGVIEYLNKNQS